MKQRNLEYEPTKILHELEDIWKKLNKLYASLPDRRWQKRLGKDWIVSDQPYHLAVFDLMLVAAIKKGKRVTKEEEKSLLKTAHQVTRWNEGEFKKRPKHFAPSDAQELYKKTQENLKKVIEKHKNRMQEKTFIPVFFGWGSCYDALLICLNHTIGEYTELCLTLKRPVDISVKSMQKREEFMLNILLSAIPKKKVSSKNFIVSLNFTGKGASSWTISVIDGKGSVVEGPSKKANLTLTMTYVTFEKMIRRVKHPMVMMLTGEMQVKGFTKMPFFLKLFSLT